MYLLLVKINPGRIDDFLRDLKRLPEKPVTGVTLYHSYNLFGAWDCCMWFEAAPSKLFFFINVQGLNNKQFCSDNFWNREAPKAVSTD